MLHSLLFVVAVVVAVAVVVELHARLHGQHHHAEDEQREQRRHRRSGYRRPPMRRRDGSCGCTTACAGRCSCIRCESSRSKIEFQQSIIMPNIPESLTVLLLYLINYQKRSIFLENYN